MERGKYNRFFVGSQRQPLTTVATPHNSSDTLSVRPSSNEVRAVGKCTRNILRLSPSHPYLIGGGIGVCFILRLPVPHSCYYNFVFS